MFTTRTSKLTTRVVTIFSVTILLGTGLLFLKGSTITRAHASSGDCDEQCRQELSAVRLATAQYHQESRALNDGFFADEECVEVPGLGGMGIHFANPSRTNDLFIDPASPEILIYEPQANGARRLVAVEYFAPVIVNGTPWFGPGPPPNGQYNAAPVLFGRTFDGPMPGHNPSMPWHYDLHAWIWRNNPSGMFAPFNPTVTCN